MGFCDASSNNEDCGCCIREDQTPPPTVERPCLQGRECTHHGGECMSRVDCDKFAAQGGNWKWERHFCDASSDNEDCGCCFPEDDQTPPPTIESPCPRASHCAAVNGECVPREQCALQNGFVFVPEYCAAD